MMSVRTFYFRHYHELKTGLDNVYYYVKKFRDYLEKEKIVQYIENIQQERYKVIDEDRLLQFFMELKNKAGIIKSCRRDIKEAFEAYLESKIKETTDDGINDKELANV